MSQLNLGKVVGRGVQSFSKTKTEGLTDTYTIAYTDGTSTAVEITHNSKNNYDDSAVAEVAKIATKVDKVDGKGLSTNDLTNELKAGYDGAVEGVATVNGTIDNLAYSDTAGGKNLINIDLIKLIRYKYINDNGEEMSLSGANYTNNFYKVKPNTVYTWTGNKTNSTNINGGVYFYNNSKVFVSRSTGFTNSPTTFTTPSNCEYIRLQIGGGETFDYTNFQIEKGTTATEYKPYIPSVKTLAKKVNDDLKMLGWTVPAECPIQNYTDSDRVFHQRVGRVDLGNLNYIYSSENNFFYTSNISDRKYGDSQNVFCYMYTLTTDKTAAEMSNIPNMTIAPHNNSVYIKFKNTSYTDATAFKSAMSGVYLYYELATPKVLDIDGNEVVVDVDKSLAVIGKCKNLLKPTLQTTTVNGVTCTNNGDGTYTVNGTASTQTNFILHDTLIINSPTKLVGRPKDSTSDSKTSYSLAWRHNGLFENNHFDYGYGAIENSVNSEIILAIEEGTTLNNALIKPMLTTNLNATYDDFVPYTGNGDTLMADVASVKNRIGYIDVDVSGTAITSVENGWYYSEGIQVAIPQGAKIISANMWGPYTVGSYCIISADNAIQLVCGYSVTLPARRNCRVVYMIL